ncbi:MAG: prepilin-type N-terminal cleavage/methylation domain-containing protein, partial [Candidatus Omnitrophica bacterium]|nr:prepilin-type N-terminal cleavage/methylation domain-containing protein [Candidatus Omnitrophota bacterium]
MRLSRAVAFTLVELLIVVVIIGILSTLGIPQYQKLVRKAQATEAKTVLRSLADAVWQYHIETGTWPAAFSDLKIPLPNSNYFNYIYYKDPGS